jgi:transglutaminase-like putative cysteine protease
MTRRAPFLLATLALFWGWQTGQWILAVALAGWLEWVMHTPLRWSLSEKDIGRIVDLTSLAVVALILFKYTGGTLADGLFMALGWSPLLLAPLVSAQVLSAREGITRRALFLSQRRSRSPQADAVVDLAPVYLGACLLAGSAETPASDAATSFIALAILSSWLLWRFARPRARRLPIWLGMLGLAIALGYVGQLGLRQGQSAIENAAVAWLSGLHHSDNDPYRAHTALGDIGRLKLSDRIVFRIEVPQTLDAPLLLRTASYDRYANTSWLTHERQFTAVAPTDTGWKLGAPTGAPSSRVRISAYLDRNGTILPVPTGAWQIEDLPVGELSRNPLGAVKVRDGPPLVRYRVAYAPAASADAPPQETDLRVPENEQAVLQALAQRLRLTARRPEQAMEAVREYFSREFRYTLELPDSHPGRTTLGHFLLERRRGHCELFAAASVLLLRQAGLPARYAVGYSVQEPSRSPGRYLVRKSHAHAWALAWHHGRWWNLDTTPALWYAHERGQRPFWQPIADLVSSLTYRVNLSRLDPSTSSRGLWLWGSLAVLTLILIYRLRLGKAMRRAPAPASKRARHAGSDAPMARIAAALQHAGLPRNRWETYRQWLRRLQRESDGAPPIRELEEILVLYERDRYWPGRLDPLQRARLHALISAWERRWRPDEITRSMQTNDGDTAARSVGTACTTGTE